jgi:hypothetical protein
VCIGLLAHSFQTSRKLLIQRSQKSFGEVIDFDAHLVSMVFLALQARNQSIPDCSLFPFFLVVTSQ